MAMTEHREPNMVKWIGVRPGHNGEQDYLYVTRDGLGSADSGAIAAGKVFCITYLYHTGSLSADAESAASVNIYAPGPVAVGNISMLRFEKAGQLVHSAGLFFPIEVPADSWIRLSVDHANLESTFGAVGFLQDM